MKDESHDQLSMFCVSLIKFIAGELLFYTQSEAHVLKILKIALESAINTKDKRKL
jgi:hypothetical protein